MEAAEGRTTGNTSGDKMSIQESLKLVGKGDVAYIEWDLVGEKVNKMSSPVMTRFRELLDEVNESKYKVLVLISRKPGIFIAGADIEEIKALKKREDILAAVEGGQSIMNKIEDLKIPVIAAIHGACLGGGCETVLACDYRIATDDSSTRIGLPEVKLGIIPGFGGCVRLPRVVGLQAAMDIILAGKAVDANKALRIGLVDQVVHPTLLEETVAKFAQNVVAEGKGKRKKRFKPTKMTDKAMESALARPFVFSQAKKLTLKQSHGHYPAPLKALEVIRKTYGESRRDLAMKTEAEGFAEVAGTDVSKNLINVFFMMEAVKKRSGVSSGVKGKPVKAIGVLGAGTMGGGIAFVAADKGIEVRMKDINNEALALGYKHSREILDKELKKRKINKFDLTRKINLISGSLDFSGFGQLDVVIEAIVEDMNIKKKVIGETARHCRPDCIIATNTSSLSVSEMAKGHPNPANFVGMHFFNPVHKMPLVEVIRGKESSDEATATVFELSKKMGKVPVVVKDGPGFLVNRLLMPYLIEAAFLLQEGADIEKVDRLMVKKFGLPMGPFTLMDEIGIDVCIKVTKIFKEAFGDRMQLPTVLDKFLELKRYGKKSNRGFYLYDEKGYRKNVDPAIYTDLGLGAPKSPHTDEEIVQRCIYPMINEAALALIEEQIVDTPDEVDLAMIMGTGFPPFRGGLLRYADTLGSAKIADDLEAYAAKYGTRFKPTGPMRTLAKTNRTFYT